MKGYKSRACYGQLLNKETLLASYAEINGLDEILTEDFEHGHRYGSVRANNPFLVAADEVHELPALHDDWSPPVRCIRKGTQWTHSTSTPTFASRWLAWATVSLIEFDR